MNALIEKSEQGTTLRLYGSHPRFFHLLAATLAFVGMLGFFYLLGRGDPGVWLGLAVLFGFVIVWGYLSYREARGEVVQVTENYLTLPAAATRSRSERMLTRSQIKQVRRVLMRYRKGHLKLCVLEIEETNGRVHRLWPSMVATQELARAMERHMGLPSETRSGLLYQIVVGLGFAVIFALLVMWFYFRG